MDEEEICGICGDVLIDNIQTLKCGHKFHNDCITQIYVSNIPSYLSQNSSSKFSKKLGLTVRKCPYCRSDAGYLTLKEGQLPIRYVHKEYPENNELDVNKYLNKNFCNAIIKSGINKGCQCKSKKIFGTNFCGRHQPK